MYKFLILSLFFFSGCLAVQETGGTKDKPKIEPVEKTLEEKRIEILEADLKKISKEQKRVEEELKKAKRAADPKVWVSLKTQKVIQEGVELLGREPEFKKIGGKRYVNVTCAYIIEGKLYYLYYGYKNINGDHDNSYLDEAHDFKLTPIKE